MSCNLRSFRMLTFQRWIYCLLLISLMQPVYAATSPEVGSVFFTRGPVTAQHADQGIRLIGKGDKLYQKDVLTTAKRSIAVIELLDGTRMTLRTNTVFRLDEVSVSNKDKSANEAAVSLLQGGLRAVSGFISKKNPGAFKVKTPVATIGIRGTEFDARLCEQNDCSQDNQQALKSTKPVIARIAVQTGKLHAVDLEGEQRRLKVGSPVYEGDTLETSIRSIAVISFNDESRITLKPKTVFAVEKHKYSGEASKNNESVMKLVKGGLRAVTGIIGKNTPEKVRFKTPVSTIGIRGTGFDLVCEAECAEAAQQTTQITTWEDTIVSVLDWFIDEANANPGAGMTAYVWDGSIVMSLPTGNLVIHKNQAFFIPVGGGKPIQFKVIPPDIRNNPAPRPDKVEIKQDPSTKANSGEDVENGLYLSFYSGEGTVTDNDGKSKPITLGADQSGFVSRGGQAKPVQVVRLQLQPVFQVQDPTPKPDMNIQQLESLDGLLNGLGGASGTGGAVSCEVQQ